MIAGLGLSWLWMIDLIVRFVRELIENLANHNGDGEVQVAQIKKAAARVLDPDEPDESLRV